MLTVTTEDRGGAVFLVVNEGDTLVAQATVVPAMLDGERGWRVHRFWLEPSRRGDDAFAAQLYPALINKAFELGWATEEDFANYRMTPDGVRVGRVLINTETDEQRDSSLRIRLLERARVEETTPVEELPPLSSDIAVLVELKDAGLTKADIVALAGPQEPRPVIEPDAPQSPSRPLSDRA